VEVSSESGFSSFTRRVVVLVRSMRPSEPGRAGAGGDIACEGQRFQDQKGSCRRWITDMYVL